MQRYHFKLRKKEFSNLTFECFEKKKKHSLSKWNIMNKMLSFVFKDNRNKNCYCIIYFSLVSKEVISVLLLAAINPLLCYVVKLSDTL